MKTGNLITKAFLSIALVGLIFTGCKKDDKSSLTDDTSEQMTNAADESRFSASSDEMLDESNDIALLSSRFRGGNFQAIVTGQHYPCNAVIDSSLINQGTITVTYNGINCANTFSRTGSVTLQLPYDATTNTVTPWSQTGSVLSITFNDFNIIRLSDSKSLTFHGTKYITNVSGGLVDDATSITTPIVHHITGMLQITFDDGTTRTWNIDRNRTFTRSNSVTTVTVTGNATENGYSNVSIWGINRKGNDFAITINTPVVLSSACNYNAISGVRMHHKVVRELTITYGVDQSGNAVTSGCPYGYKLDWVDKNGGAHQVILPY